MRVLHRQAVARGLAIAVVVVVTLSGVASAQVVGDPVADADLIIDGPPEPWLELFVTPSAVATATTLGGVTLFASASPGGPILVRATRTPPPPGAPGSWPDFEFAGIPTGTYYIVLVYGIVGASTAPASAWRRLDFGTACAGPPGQSTITPTVSGTTVTLAISGSTGGSNGCPPEYQRIEVGSAPGLTDIQSFAWTSPLFAVAGVPAGDYYLRAYGVNRFGRGPNSLEMPLRVPDGTCVPPPVPENVVATIGPGVVSLAWTLPASTPAVTFHEVWVFLANPGGGLTQLGPPIRLPASTAITAPVSPGSYTVFLRSASPCGKSAYTAAVPFVVP